jgi:hypothetical protein
MGMKAAFLLWGRGPGEMPRRTDVLEGESSLLYTVLDEWNVQVQSKQVVEVPHACGLVSARTSIRC